MYKRPKGLVIFSWLIIISSFLHMHTLLCNRDWYYQVYGHWPQYAIVLRYCFSWFQRFAGIAAAIGILCFKDFFRKLGIAIGVFTILTIHWKHPYGAFLRSNQILDNKFRPLLQSSGIQTWLHSVGLEDINFASYTIISVVGHSLLDILFWAGFIYYFTRRQTKDLFESQEGNKA